MLRILPDLKFGPSLLFGYVGVLGKASHPQFLRILPDLKFGPSLLFGYVGVLGKASHPQLLRILPDLKFGPSLLSGFVGVLGKASGVFSSAFCSHPAKMMGFHIFFLTSVFYAIKLPYLDVSHVSLF